MFELVEAEKAHFPIGVLCDTLEVSRSGFYAWKTRPRSKRSKANELLAVQIAATHKRSRETYGSPRVQRALRKKGLRVGKKRIERVMRERGLVGAQKRRFRRTTDSNHDNPIAPNLLQRDFQPVGPNKVWAGDVTYVATDEGFAYLAVLIDLYSRRVVGWAMSANNDTELALAALRCAVRLRGVHPGLIHHTDRGSPYASDEYRRELAANGMLASMSRKGDCWDNAVAESFFATARVDVIDHAWYPTRASAQFSISEYIENFYNPERLHSHLDYVSPIEFELKTAMVESAA